MHEHSLMYSLRVLKGKKQQHKLINCKTCLKTQTHYFQNIYKYNLKLIIFTKKIKKIKFYMQYRLLQMKYTLFTFIGQNPPLWWGDPSETEGASQWLVLNQRSWELVCSRFFFCNGFWSHFPGRWLLQWEVLGAWFDLCGNQTNPNYVLASRLPSKVLPVIGVLCHKLKASPLFVTNSG